MKPNHRHRSEAAQNEFPPVRLLTAVPICDGHDAAINTINLELVRHGMEVVYLGYHRPARDIVRAAIQEDVRAVGISSYNGGHVEFFSEVLALLKEEGASHIEVFGGGGATITPMDIIRMKKNGVQEIFSAGTPLAAMADYLKQRYSKAARAATGRQTPCSDLRLARALTALETGSSPRPLHPPRREKRSQPPRVAGFTGPGGAGKTTLIDGIVLRILKNDTGSRIAILSHDPSIAGNGALLGDRATMIYSQNDRVFMRSFATRGRAGGLAPASERSLQFLREGPFDWILVETVGIGQEAMPFAREGMDKTILVMSPGYGSRLQLQKNAMLGIADAIVVNKADVAGARTAWVEIEQLISRSGRGQHLQTTTAKKHRDEGVDQLYEWIRR